MNIKIPANFTLSELRAFIEGEAHEAPEGHYTAQEWADHFRVSVGLMRRLLNQAKVRGLLQRTEIKGETLDDKSYTKSVYALQGKDDISDSHKATQGDDSNGST